MHNDLPFEQKEDQHSIILVEDNIDVLNLLAGHFTLAKFNVYKTSTAEECLEIIKDMDKKIDIVLVNGKIASERGAMLIVNIKKLNPNIKVFAVADNENNKTRILDYGTDMFAIKPISAITVVEKATMLLLKEPAAQSD